MTIGRFNPPTIGHSLLLQQLDAYSKQGYAATLFLTHTQIKPLDYRRAYKLTKDMLGRQRRNGENRTRKCICHRR